MGDRSDFLTSNGIYTEKCNGTIVRFYGGKILRDHRLVSEDLWVSKGKVIAPQKHSDKDIDVKEFIVSPGFIDLQLNGAFGVDLTTSPEKVGQVAQQLPKYGVTSFLPTVVSSTADQYRQILPLLQPCRGGAHGASSLGVHLEGPFVNSCRCGVHDTEALQSDCYSLKECYGSLDVRSVYYGYMFFC